MFLGGCILLTVFCVKDTALGRTRIAVAPDSNSNLYVYEMLTVL